MPAVKLMGQDCPAAGVFLAIRSLLVRAGAPRQLKPSTRLESYVLRWPKVFLNEISPLAPGGLPFYWANDVFTYVFCLGPIAGCGLLFIGQFANVPEITILGVCVCVLGWAGGWLGHKCYAGQPTLPGMIARVGRSQPGNWHLFACLAAMILTRKQEIGEQVIGIGIADSLARFARITEVHATPNAGFFYLRDGFREAVVRPKAIWPNATAALASGWGQLAGRSLADPHPDSMSTHTSGHR